MKQPQSKLDAIRSQLQNQAQGASVAEEHEHQAEQASDRDRSSFFAILFALLLTSLVLAWAGSVVYKSVRQVVAPTDYEDEEYLYPIPEEFIDRRVPLDSPTPTPQPDKDGPSGGIPLRS